MTEEAVFNAALAKRPEERGVYLDEACGDNRELRERVEALLRSHEAEATLADPSDFDPDATPQGIPTPPPSFDSGAVTESRPDTDQPNFEGSRDTVGHGKLPGFDFPAVTEGPGSQIGPYKILQRMGEGGFGVVYMAEQKTPVRRRVALKIIKAGMDSREVLSRFETEKQALALMDHANIARVFDGGATETGRPYFVMELVKGVPITDYCDQHKLSVKRRLDLFMEVCSAIQHAHQKGIIHRDIKPPNVLVAEDDGRPVPKVIDFGVAKAIHQPLTEQTVFTQIGQVIGTPTYMSPEQAETNQLDIDTRSDVYSLGVLLYELLTGTTPIERERMRSAAFDEMLRMIREVEPPKPSTRLSESGESLSTASTHRHVEPKRLTTTLRGELDWIAMRALDKDRTRRYESASSLADDIRRYLDDEPVVAGPPSAGYKLRKFAGKHRRALSVALAFAATLLIATGVSVWQALRATKAETAAKRDQARAVEAEGKQRDARIREEGIKEEAIAYLKDARTAADEWLINLSGDLLYYPGLNPTRQRLLREAERHYKAFSARTSDDPKLMLEYARSAVRLGDVQRLLGSHSDAENSYSSAEATFEKLLKQNPDDNAAKLELANSRIGLGATYAQSVDKRQEAQDAYASALVIIERLLAEDPKDADYRNARGRCTMAMSNLLDQTDQSGRERLLRESLAAFDGLAQEFDNPKYRHRLIESLFLLAGAQQDADRPDEAVVVLQRAIGTYDKLIESNKSRPDLFAGRAECRVALANSYRQLARYKVAVEAHDAAITDYESAVQMITTPLDAQHYLKIIGREYDQLAGISHRLGASSDAKQLSIEAVNVFIDLVNAKPNDPELVALESQSRTRLAEVLGELSEDALAEQHFEEAIEAYHELREYYPKEPRYREQFAVCLAKYARLLERMKRTADAKDYYESAIGHLEAVVETATESDNSRHELALCYAYYGDMYRSASDAEQATPLYEKAAALWRGLRGRAASDYELALLLAGAAGTTVHDAQQAISLSQQLLDAHPEDAAYHQLLGICHFRAGNWQSAATALQKAAEKRLLEDSSDWFYLAMTSHQLKRTDEASAMYERAVLTMDKQRSGNLHLERLRQEAANLLGASPDSEDK